MRFRGDAFYTPPGHVPVTNEPGTEFVSFSPSEELRAAEAVNDEEHAGDAGRLNALGEEARAEPLLGRRPCCENTPAAARAGARGR